MIYFSLVQVAPLLDARSPIITELGLVPEPFNASGRPLSKRQRWSKCPGQYCEIEGLKLEITPVKMGHFDHQNVRHLLQTVFFNGYLSHADTVKSGIQFPCVHSLNNVRNYGSRYGGRRWRFYGFCRTNACCRSRLMFRANQARK